MKEAKNERGVEGLLREILALEQDSLIVSLGLAGLTQHEIRKVVGVDMHRVVRITKAMRKLKRDSE